MIHIVIGLPGSGKSTVARLLAEKLNAKIYNTDVLFDEMFPEMKRTDTGGIPDVALEKIYHALGPKAVALAKGNRKGHFIFEGSFRYAWQRQGIIDALEGIDHPYCVIWVTLEEKENERRVRVRHESGEAADTVEDWRLIKNVYENPDKDAKSLHIIDNSSKSNFYPPRHLVEAIDNYIRTVVKTLN